MKPGVITLFGGSGFVGRHLVRHLAPTGATLRLAVRDPEAAKFLKPLADVGKIVPMRADITRPEEVERAVEGAEAVVNLVGILHQWGARSFEAIHADGAATLARAAARAGARRFVQMSALGADPTSASAYARSKAAGEAAVRSGFAGAAVVRASVIFGPEDAFFNRFAALLRIAPGLPVFFRGWPSVDLVSDFPFPRIDFHAGTGRLQPVYVGDVARALAKLATERGHEGKTVELGGPRVYSYAELMRLVIAWSGRRRFLIPVPFALANVAAFLLERLPFAPLTRDQLRMLESANVVAPGAVGLAALGIEATAAEIAVPTYLSRFRPPRAAAGAAARLKL